MRLSTTQLPAEDPRRRRRQEQSGPWRCGGRADGKKEALDLWIEQSEGAKFWLKVFNELKNRGLNDILIAVVDGLRGFPEAIEAAYFRKRRSRPASCT